MTKIEELTIGVQNAGFSGYLSGEQVTTYTQLLEAVELLDWATGGPTPQAFATIPDMENKGT